MPGFDKTGPQGKGASGGGRGGCRQQGTAGNSPTDRNVPDSGQCRGMGGSGRGMGRKTGGGRGRRQGFVTTDPENGEEPEGL